jgi:hypothetical protein
MGSARWKDEGSWHTTALPGFDRIIVFVFALFALDWQGKIGVSLVTHRPAGAGITTEIW